MHFNDVKKKAVFRKGGVSGHPGLSARLFSFTHIGKIEHNCFFSYLRRKRMGGWRVVPFIYFSLLPLNRPAGLF